MIDMVIEIELDMDMDIVIGRHGNRDRHRETRAR